MMKATSKASAQHFGSNASAQARRASTPWPVHHRQRHLGGDHRREERRNAAVTSRAGADVDRRAGFAARAAAERSACGSRRHCAGSRGRRRRRRRDGTRFSVRHTTRRESAPGRASRAPPSRVGPSSSSGTQTPAPSSSPPPSARPRRVVAVAEAEAARGRPDPEVVGRRQDALPRQRAARGAARYPSPRAPRRTASAWRRATARRGRRTPPRHTHHGDVGDGQRHVVAPGAAAGWSCTTPPNRTPARRTSRASSPGPEPATPSAAARGTPTRARAPPRRRGRCRRWSQIIRARGLGGARWGVARRGRGGRRCAAR